MHRYGLALTHKGDYDFGKSNSYIEFSRTKNNRLNEGSAGSGEGQIVNPAEGEEAKWNQTTYDTLNAKSEWDWYFDRHTLTAGAEFRGEKLNMRFQRWNCRLTLILDRLCRIKTVVTQNQMLTWSVCT